MRSENGSFPADRSPRTADRCLPGPASELCRWVLAMHARRELFFILNRSSEAARGQSTATPSSPRVCPGARSKASNRALTTPRPYNITAAPGGAGAGAGCGAAFFPFSPLPFCPVFAVPRCSIQRHHPPRFPLPPAGDPRPCGRKRRKRLRART